MNLCEIVRSEFNHDREFCLYPLRYHDGLVQICTVAYNRAITINLRFFNDKYEFQVWLNTENGEIIYQPSGFTKKCFMMEDFVYKLFQHSKEAGLLMLYSVFFTAKRCIYHADDDVYAAIIGAADAAADAYAAVDGVYAAAAAADAAIAAPDDVYAVAAHVAVVKGDIRRALKSIFKFRKELMRK